MTGPSDMQDEGATQREMESGDAGRGYRGSDDLRTYEDQGPEGAR